MPPIRYDDILIPITVYVRNSRVIHLSAAAKRDRCAERAVAIAVGNIHGLIVYGSRNKIQISIAVKVMRRVIVVSSLSNSTKTSP